MSKVKYIVVEGSFREMIIFGDTKQHADIAQKFKNEYNEIVSAGFLSVGYADVGSNAIAVRAYGESVSLGLKSDPNRDSKLAGRTLGIDWA
jgi:hypothetical protein